MLPRRALPLSRTDVALPQPDRRTPALVLILDPSQRTNFLNVGKEWQHSPGKHGVRVARCGARDLACCMVKRGECFNCPTNLLHVAKEVSVGPAGELWKPQYV